MSSLKNNMKSFIDFTLVIGQAVLTLENDKDDELILKLRGEIYPMNKYELVLKYREDLDLIEMYFDFYYKLVYNKKFDDIQSYPDEADCEYKFYMFIDEEKFDEMKEDLLNYEFNKYVREIVREGEVEVINFDNIKR